MNVPLSRSTRAYRNCTIGTGFRRQTARHGVRVRQKLLLDVTTGRLSFWHHDPRYYRRGAARATNRKTTAASPPPPPTKKPTLFGRARAGATGRGFFFLRENVFFLISRARAYVIERGRRRYALSRVVALAHGPPVAYRGNSFSEYETGRRTGVDSRERGGGGARARDRDYCITRPSHRKTGTASAEGRGGHPIWTLACPRRGLAASHSVTTARFSTRKCPIKIAYK